MIINLCLFISSLEIVWFVDINENVSSKKNILHIIFFRLDFKETFTRSGNDLI